MDALDQIRQSIFSLQPLTPEEWAAFADKLEFLSMRKGDFLLTEGQVENSLYFLNTGSTRNFFIKHGKEFTVDFQFGGDFVTGYYSFITREPSIIYIELLEDAELLALSYHQLQLFYRDSKNGERIGRLIAEYQYTKRLKREIDLLSSSAEARYNELLAKNPALVHKMSVKHLSSFLGIQPESLSRIRKLHFRN